MNLSAMVSDVAHGPLIFIFRFYFLGRGGGSGAEYRHDKTIVYNNCTYFCKMYVNGRTRTYVVQLSHIFH